MLKILRSVFTAARREGLIDDNPAERVTILKRRTDFERRAFTLPELKRIMELADEEWRGMILFRPLYRPAAGRHCHADKAEP